MDRKPAILALLKARGTASLADVAAHLEISKQGALRHLDALAEQGLVVATSEEHSGPGRPEHRYHLTPAAGASFPSGHRELAAELVDFLGRTQLDRFFAERARRVEAEYAGRLAGLDLDQRVRELARLAAAHGYMTEVVETPDGLALRHCNCPIGDVAARSAGPCRHEQEMYVRLLGAEVARSSWQAEGDSTCTYTIKKEGTTVG